MSHPGADFDLPPDKQRAMARAKRICWASIVLLISIIGVIAVVMGSSQTMKAMWVEDVVSLVAPIAFLVGAKYRTREPNPTFPYGYRRAVLVAFQSGAVALFFIGVYMFGDSLLKLLKAERPTIQSVVLFGHQIWLGWLMIVALIYSVIPPIVLGHMKLPLARELHDKVLHVSAKIDKGDWLSGIAGVLGILGIALGLWWADAAAAAFISIEIVRDGYSNLRNSVAQLMNKRPSDMESKEPDPITDKIRDELLRLDWIDDAAVRLREDGDVLSGEIFVKPKDERDLLRRLQQAQKLAESLDWRLHDLNVVPLRDVAAGEQQRAA
jgi:cation diffusion facilitator family transporter